MNTIYHYTRIDSLLSIMGESSKENPNLCLWASHYLYANDPEEKKIGEKLLFQYLPEVEEEMGIPYENRISTIIKDKDINEQYNNMQIKNKYLHKECASSYYLSFSLSEDSLPMWNMYGNNGTGISIGFNYSKLRAFFKKTKNTDLDKCWYEIESNIGNWKQLIAMLYHECLEIQSRQREDLIKNNKIESEDRVNKIYALSSLHFLRSSITVAFKEPAYKHEEEVKVLFEDTEENIYYRASKDYILPYIKINIPLEFLERIIIGPTLNYELTELSLMKFLDSKGISDKVEIIQSQVPYRS